MKKKEFLGISNGEYTFSETEWENTFIFYRNDRGILEGDFGDEILMFYNEYMQRVVKITRPVVGNLIYKTSEDKKIIIVCDKDKREL